jgi:uncharacterized protein
MYVGSYMARTKSYWLGGLLGAAAGAALGWFLGGLVALFIVALGLGLLGLLLDALLSSAYVYQQRSGKGGAWRRTMGGFSGAGRGGWHGSKGFGGFGGGRSGGGGASRRF